MIEKDKPQAVRNFEYRSVRVPVACRCAILTASGTIWATCLDLSEQGLAAETSRLFTPGEQVTVNFACPDSTPISIHAQVEYQQNRRCGLTFLFSSVQERNSIHELLRTFARQNSSNPI